MAKRTNASINVDNESRKTKPVHIDGGTKKIFKTEIIDIDRPYENFSSSESSDDVPQDDYDDRVNNGQIGEEGTVDEAPPKYTGNYVPPTETEEEVRKYTLDRSNREFDDSYRLYDDDDDDKQEVKIDKCVFPELPTDYNATTDHGAEKMQLPLEDITQLHEIEMPDDMDTDRSNVIESQLQDFNDRLSDEEEDVLLRKLDRPVQSKLKCRPKREDVKESFFAAATSEGTEDDTPRDIIVEGKCRSKRCQKFGPPNIPVRENKVSRFRYMHARRPPGNKVFFRPANGKYMQPFFPTDRGGCFKD